MRKYAIICEFLHNLCINRYSKCFENANICGKICDMRIFAKYAIACLHITGIPIQCARVVLIIVNICKIKMFSTVA